MKTSHESPRRTAPWHRTLALAGMAAGAWALSAGMSQAHAGDVNWSIGVNVPGLHLGVSTVPSVSHRPPSTYYSHPVAVRPAPVVYQTYPVVVQAAPVYYHPTRVVVREPVVVYGSKWRGRGHRHHNHY